MNAVGTNLCQITLGRRIAPHLYVHSGCDGERAFGRITRQDQIGQQIVADAVGDFRHDIGRARCDQHGVGLAAQIDVGDVAVRTVAVVPQRVGHRLARECGEGQRCDEFFRAFGHDDGYAQALFAQQTHQLGGFVRRDAAADA